MDVRRETAATRRLYGLDDAATRNFGTRCLIARRLVERGVRFVQLISGSGDSKDWDHHDNSHTGTLRQARARFEGEYITAVLEQHHGRISEAAKALGVQRTNLYRKMRSLRIDRERRLK